MCRNLYRKPVISHEMQIILCMLLFRMCIKIIIIIKFLESVQNLYFIYTHIYYIYFICINSENQCIENENQIIHVCVFLCVCIIKASCHVCCSVNEKREINFDQIGKCESNKKALIKMFINFINIGKLACVLYFIYI